ncbi:MAG: hypothetical protein EOO44_22530 [Flavobacterium sp.]|nr:MAG: hypothetical protein EOO44_22530 [Flavobacterium sp.]
MKKENLLSKAEMKKVLGGKQDGGDNENPCSVAGGLCSTWTEEICCSGLTCTGQDGQKPGLCA